MIRTTHPDSPLQRVEALQNGGMEDPYTERPDRIRIYRAWSPRYDATAAEDFGPWVVDGYDSNTGQITQEISQKDTFAGAISNGIPYIASMYRTFAVELGGDDITQPEGADMRWEGYCQAYSDGRKYICTRDAHPHSPTHVAGNGDEILAIWTDRG